MFKKDVLVIQKHFIIFHLKLLEIFYISLENIDMIYLTIVTVKFKRIINKTIWEMFLWFKRNSFLEW